jgi:hypothetical protein
MKSAIATSYKLTEGGASNLPVAAEYINPPELNRETRKFDRVLGIRLANSERS